tara:strand:- start:60 stop:464 length:405 start_codon:yes stop_codon:yes gene_type:complete
MNNLWIYLSVSFHHAWFNSEHTKSIVSKFTPQNIEGTVVSTVGVNNYIKTKILLSDESVERRSILQITSDYKMNILVFSIDEDKLCVDSFLWTLGSNKNICMKHFINFISNSNVAKIKIGSGLEEDEKKMLHNN